MAEKFIINATATALAAGGETTGAWTATESTGAPTDVEIGTIISANGYAAMQSAPSTAEKVAVAWCLLDSVTSKIDLSSENKRTLFKMKQGLDEYQALLDAIVVAEL